MENIQKNIVLLQSRSEITSVSISKELHRKIKIAAAISGKTVFNFVNSSLADAVKGLRVYRKGASRGRRMNFEISTFFCFARRGGAVASRKQSASSGQSVK